MKYRPFPIVLAVCTGTLMLSADLLLADEVHVSIDYDRETGTGSPYVFGGTQPRGLSESQWDQLKRQGFTFVRSQADLTRLVPCESLAEYRANRANCQAPTTWKWKDGIYGDDFAQRAIRRGMQVCMVIKNARWNRYPNAPDDEETVPRDFDVWADVLRKIVNHYNGQLTYIELFNEVDREPQLRVEGSSLTRKQAYCTIVKEALGAVASSQYPATLVGGPAAAGTGDEIVEWLLSDETIRKRIGFLSFHAFDDLHYPQQSVERLRNVMRRHGRQLPIVRSSYVPEIKDSTHEPGTTDAVYVAEHLVGALRDGLAASGLWEIQNRSGDSDYRYWFDGDDLTPAASLWPLLTQTLGLGKGWSRSVTVSADSSVPVYAARNHAGRHVAVVVLHHAAKLSVSVSGRRNVPVKSAKLYKVSRSGRLFPVRQVTPTRSSKIATFSVATDKAAIFGFEFQ